MDPERKLENSISTDTVAPGGALQTEQSDRFIDLTVDKSVMFGKVRILRKTNPKGEFDRLLFGSVVTEGADEYKGSDPTVALSSPTHSKVEYSTVKLRSAMDISTETFEENIEGQGYRGTVMNALATRISTDLEMLAIQGDKANNVAKSTAEEKLLVKLDGWYHKSVSGDGNQAAGHTVNVAGGNVSKTVFSKMIRALPIQFKQNRAALRFYASPSIIQDYRDNLSGRLTTLGDSALTGNIPLTVFGIPIEEVPLIPENQSYTSGSDTYSDATFMWLTYPLNFFHVISREIEVYWMFQPRKDAWEATIYTRVDDGIENTDAVVTSYNLRIAG